MFKAARYQHGHAESAELGPAAAVRAVRAVPAVRAGRAFGAVFGVGAVGFGGTYVGGFDFIAVGFLFTLLCVICFFGTI